MMEAGGFDNIIVKMPLKVIQLTGLTWKEELNEHGVATITGILEKEEVKKALYRISIDTNIQILMLEENEEKVLFSGVPTNMDFIKVSNYYEMRLELTSSSILMDLHKRSRSYQNKDKLLHEIVQEIMKQYQGHVIDLICEETKQGEVLIQYEETDWEFLRRIISTTGTKIYPVAQGTTPNIIIGLAKSRTHQLNRSLSMHRIDIDEVRKDSVTSEHVYGFTYQTYVIKSTIHYYLGDEVIYKNIPYVIMKKESKIQQGELINIYTIRNEKGIRQTKIHNKELSGVSLEGTIIARQSDKLKLKLDIDKVQKEEEANWFPFASCYTAKDSTGWYVMPEVGEKVMLYVPTNQESKAFVTMVKRMDGKKNMKTQVPSVKNFGTREGNQLRISKKDITMKAPKGKTYLRLDTNGGVEVKSSHDITLKTGKGMELHCESLEVKSNDKIVMKTQHTNIIVDNVVHIRG